MTKAHKVGVMWFLGGVAFLVAGLITEPRRLFDIAVGVLFFIVGILTVTRARRAPSATTTGRKDGPE